MNCNLYKVLNYLKNYHDLTIDDDEEKQLYFYFNLTIPQKFKWETKIKISNEGTGETIIKNGLITRNEYLSIKYKSPDTIVDFGSMGETEFKTTLSNVEFNDNEDIVKEYEERFIIYDNNFISYIK